VDLLRRKYISTADSFKPVDMARKIGFFTMDVITDLAFAKPFGNLKNDKDMHDYIRSTEAICGPNRAQNDCYSSFENLVPNGMD
jgi:hypothetical protein